jgi:hypothetical protein
MKFSTLLVSVAAAALFFLDGTSASPVGLTARAAPTDKVVVG